jgi:hypothetical protein
LLPASLPIFQNLVATFFSAGTVARGRPAENAAKAAKLTGLRAVLFPQK